jgi:hypothetical protein
MYDDECSFLRECEAKTASYGDDDDEKMMMSVKAKKQKLW